MVLADIDFPPDIRVEKEARAIRDAGYNVYILCTSNGQRPPEDDWEGCKVIRVPRLSNFYHKINWLFKSITFHDLQWSNYIPAIIERNNIELLHVHDLPLLGTVLSIAKNMHIPVIADLHENYPAALRYYAKDRSNKNPLKRIIYNPSRWQAYEKRSALIANHILVVVDEAKQRFVTKGIPENKITVIENTVDADFFESIQLDDELIERYKDDFVLSYIGGFGGRHRGLDNIIKAMPQILEHIPNARLLLVGDGGIKPVLQNMIAERSIVNKVTFVSWQPFEKVPSYITLSDICLVPHNSNPHTEATSPHKLFQYMLLSKPVVVSSCKPLQRVVDETGCGLVFQAGDSNSLAQTIIQLQDPELRQGLGEAGRRAVLSKYNWSETSKKLIGVYEQFQ